MNRNHLPERILSLAVASLVFALAPSTSAHAQGTGLSNGTQVEITQEFRESTRLAQAFVETGSDSPLVLCGFNENSPGYGGVRLTGLTLMCRQRTVDFGSGPIHGTSVLILLPGTFQPEGDFTLWVTIFHYDAPEYGDPQSCQGQC